MRLRSATELHPHRLRVYATRWFDCHIGPCAQEVARRGRYFGARWLTLVWPLREGKIWAALPVDLVVVIVCVKLRRFFHYRRSMWVKLVLSGGEWRLTKLPLVPENFPVHDQAFAAFACLTQFVSLCPLQLGWLRDGCLGPGAKTRLTDFVASGRRRRYPSTMFIDKPVPRAERSVNPKDFP